MGFEINRYISNKKLIFRYLPSGLIFFLVLSSLIWSIFISQFGNKCTTIDASFLLSDELVQSTNDLTNNMLTLIQNKKYKDIKEMLDDSLGDYNTVKQSLEDIRQILPQQVLQNLTIVGVEREITYTDTATLEQILTITEVNYPSSDLVIEMLQYRVDDEVTIGGFRVTPKDELVEIFTATMQDATFGGYMMIVCMLFILAISLYSLILCINTDIERRKWLWILFIIFGFFEINFNWSSQAYSFNLINISLLSVGWDKANCFSPLFLSFGLPIGAIIFLCKRHKPKFDKIIKR